MMKSFITLTIAMFLATGAWAIKVHNVFNVDRDSYYSDIQTAINEADPGDELKLLNNITVENNAVTVNRAITINGNGYILTINNGNLRLEQELYHKRAPASVVLKDIKTVVNNVSEKATIREAIEVIDLPLQADNISLHYISNGSVAFGVSISTYYSKEAMDVEITNSHIQVQAQSGASEVGGIFIAGNNNLIANNNTFDFTELELVEAVYGIGSVGDKSLTAKENSFIFSENINKRSPIPTNLKSAFALSPYYGYDKKNNTDQGILTPENSEYSAKRVFEYSGTITLEDNQSQHAGYSMLVTSPRKTPDGPELQWAKNLIATVINNNEGLPGKGFLYPFPGEYIPPYNLEEEFRHAYIQEAIDNAADGQTVRIPGGNHTGNVNTAVRNGISLYPGNSPACVTITGDLTVTDQDELILDIFGTEDCIDEADGYTQLTVTGDVDLGGILLSPQLGFIPEIGDNFNIINANSINNEFDQGSEITATYQGHAVTFDINYGADTVNLEVTNVEAVAIPLSGWALYLGFILMIAFAGLRISKGNIIG